MSVSLRRRRRGLNSRGGRLLISTGPFLNEIEDRWAQEYTDQTCRQHASDHSGPHDLAGHGAGSRSNSERHAAEDEGKGSHKNRTKAYPGSFEGGINEGLPFFELILGELDDQNCILRR